MQIKKIEKCVEEFGEGGNVFVSPTDCESVMCVYYFKQTDEGKGRDESGQTLSSRLMKRLVNISEACMFCQDVMLSLFIR